MDFHDHSRPTRFRALLQSEGGRVAIVCCRRGAAVYRQGDAGASVLYLESGRVRLSVIDRGGREAVLGFLDAGAFLGEEALHGGQDRRETAIAVTPVQALAVETSHMIRLVEMQPVVRAQLLTHILARQTSLEASLAAQLLGSSEQRLARVLLMLAACGNRRGCTCPLPEVSQTILAEMVGTTRSHVNLFLKKFREQGFIRPRDGALLMTPSLLAVAEGARPRVH
jgi:CRP-like cAMP-binding protein